MIQNFLSFFPFVGLFMPRFIKLTQIENITGVLDKIALLFLASNMETRAAFFGKNFTYMYTNYG